jgi:hypothetical protein
MNDCTAVRPLLPAAVYDDLPPDQAAAVRRHVETCPGCRAELAALQEVRDALNATPGPPVPPVRVDTARIYRDAASRQARRLRRWRRAAAAACAAAAVLAAVLLLRLEVRLDGHQAVLRWGDPPAPPPAVVKVEPQPQVQPPEAPPRVVVAAPAEVGAEEVRLLKQLIHALAANLETCDRQQVRELAALRKRLDRLQAQADERWAATESYISALQTAQSQLARKE